MKLTGPLFGTIFPLLIAHPMLAAVTATVVTGTWELYEGATEVSSHASQDACVAAANALNAVGYYTCRTTTGVTVAITRDPTTPPRQPLSAMAPATLSITPQTLTAPGNVALSWSCMPSSAIATLSAAGQSQRMSSASGSLVAPIPATITVTLTCADGTAQATDSKTVTVATDGGGSAGGDAITSPATTLPVPAVLGTAISLNVRTFNPSDVSLAPLLKYAETARRNWNFGGHNVSAGPFDANQGYWDYENCTTHYAAWLFDRPSAWFKLAAMTGDGRYLDQAISDFRYWAGNINAQGYFSCKMGEADTKYLEILPFLSYEQATGDKSYRPVADRVYAASAQGFSVAYSTSEALWTEREVGIHLGAALDYYRLTGNQLALARAAALVHQWTTVAGAIGAPQVSYTQHEGGGPGGTTPTNPTNSPWMSAFYFQAARRYWQITGDAEILQQVSRYFDWLTVDGLYDGSLFHPEFAGVTVPRYLTGELIGDAGYDEGNLLHCPDVQGLVAFAVDAKRRLGLSTTVADGRLAELKRCSARMWANWTRDTRNLPKYRIQSPRAWNWWLRGLYEYSLH